MFSVNDARKRSSYGYHTVTTVTTVTDDRRGTLGQETEVVPRAGSVRAGSGPGHQSPPKPHKPWKPLDGPLVAAPQPDLVQHSQGVDRLTIAHSIITDFTSASKSSIRRFVITDTMLTNPPVSYDNCVMDPISR